MEVQKMSEVKNIYQKLQVCRVGLQKKTMKKSGKNDFSHYDYFELGDFLPHINDLMLENGLTAIFKYTPENACLKIVDTDKPESTIEFNTPIETTQLKGCNSMQNIGGTQTFARRYLYIMAFEIAENDLVNQRETDTDAEEGRKKIDTAKVKVLKDHIQKTSTNEAEFCKWARVKKIEELMNKNFPVVLKVLNEKAEQMSGSKDLEGII
jgi:hypothetical protein